jgi:hypothetical protein
MPQPRRLPPEEAEAMRQAEAARAAANSGRRVDLSSAVARPVGQPAAAPPAAPSGASPAEASPEQRAAWYANKALQAVQVRRIGSPNYKKDTVIDPTSPNFNAVDMRQAIADRSGAEVGSLPREHPERIRRDYEHVRNVLKPWAMGDPQTPAIIPAYHKGGNPDNIHVIHAVAGKTGYDAIEAAVATSGRSEQILIDEVSKSMGLDPVKMPYDQRKQIIAGAAEKAGQAANYLYRAKGDAISGSLRSMGEAVTAGQPEELANILTGLGTNPVDLAKRMLSANLIDAQGLGIGDARYGQIAKGVQAGMDWLQAKPQTGVELVDGLPNWAYTAAAGSGVAAGIAALLADRGVPQVDPAAYQQQQQLAAYGGY